jgi:hypothetical protein
MRCSSHGHREETKGSHDCRTRQEQQKLEVAVSAKR